MTHPFTFFAFFLALAAYTTTAPADTRYLKTVEGEFEDVFFDLQDNIVNLGLVVERTGDIGAMLERTSKAVTGEAGTNTAIYINAKYLLFCSSQLTFKATRADPRNLSLCPFIVYAFETVSDPGKVSVGYRRPDLGSLPETDPIYIEVHEFLKTFVDTTIADY